MLVRPHDGRVQQGQGRVKVAGFLPGRQDGLGGALRHARLDPAAPTHVEGVPWTVDRRQITPGTTRACAEEHRFARLAIGHRLGKALFAMRARENRFDLLPLRLAKPVKPAVVGRRHHSIVHAGKIIDVTFGFNLIVNTL
jgi:hypothetical protein